METYQKLKEKLGENLKENVEMKQYSTFKLGGHAKYFFIAKNRKDIVKAIKAAKEMNLNFFILGGGSNILISDSGYDGLVIKNEARKIEIKRKNIAADSGAMLGQVILLAMENGLTSMEWASGIPGTVGGAVRGNAGAYGGDTSSNITEVEAYNVEKDEIIKMKNAECKFGYRESILKKNKNLIVLGAVFKLRKGNESEIKNTMLEIVKKRTCSQPKFPSVGCNFKNIIATEEVKRKVEKLGMSPAFTKVLIDKRGKIGAAWFIDKAGLKGFSIGGAKVSDEHANFIIKFKEDCKADDVARLISHVKEKVKDKFGIELEEELQYVGF